VSKHLSLPPQEKRGGEENQILHSLGVEVHFEEGGERHLLTMMNEGVYLPTQLKGPTPTHKTDIIQTASSKGTKHGCLGKSTPLYNSREQLYQKKKKGGGCNKFGKMSGTGGKS